MENIDFDEEHDRDSLRSKSPDRNLLAPSMIHSMRKALAKTMVNESEHGGVSRRRIPDQSSLSSPMKANSE
jgi:hypothetical protein